MNRKENLIGILPKLREIEQKATKPDWYARETSMTEKFDRKYFNYMRIGSTVEDRVYMADIGEWIDLKLTIALRNSAPAMIGVLEQFREGDAEMLRWVLDETVDNGSDIRKMIERLQRAATLMEGKGDEKENLIARRRHLCRDMGSLAWPDEALAARAEIMAIDEEIGL